MAVLYWIHLEEHTDISSQGYIGVTKYDSKTRFRKHLEALRKYNKLGGVKDRRTLFSAINKHGIDSVVVTDLVIGEEDYIYDLENKLRPSCNIGWNIATGGEFSVTGNKVYSDNDIYEVYRLRAEEGLIGTCISEKTNISMPHVAQLLNGKCRPDLLDSYLKSAGIESMPPATQLARKALTFDEATAKEIFRLSEEDGVRPSELARMFNLGTRAVGRLLRGETKAFAHLWSCKTPSTQRKWGIDVVESMFSEKKSGTPINDICSKYSISPRHLYGLLKEYSEGLKTQSIRKI